MRERERGRHQETDPTQKASIYVLATVAYIHVRIVALFQTNEKL